MRFTFGAQAYAEGSVLVEAGDTKVLCAVSIEDKVPSFLKGQGRGWVTAEYGMLPRSTLTRRAREIGQRDGRSVEIQRLIGRAMRAVVHLDALGERTLTVDCDVLQADGGTRTASITGAYVALHQALGKLVRQGALAAMPLRSSVAAVSVGVVEGEALLDLRYEEDMHAEVDFNVVRTGVGGYVEVQGTAEGAPFSPEQLQAMLALAGKGIAELTALQEAALRTLGGA